MKSWIISSCLLLFVLFEGYAAGYSGLETETNTPSACQAPISLKTIAVTDSSALVRWVSINTPVEDHWEIELINQFEDTILIENVLNDTFELFNLRSGTAYSFSVRAICSSDTSSWSSTQGKFVTHLLNNDPCDVDLEIQDNYCPSFNEFVIRVDGVQQTNLGSSVLLQEIRLTIEHDWLTDLKAKLVSPSGKEVLLFDQNGGTNDNFGDPQNPCSLFMTLLNANACGEQSIAVAPFPYTGRYTPLGNLNDFNDLSNPNGNWKLLICDDAGYNTGKLKYVELIFQPANCVPPSGLSAISVDSTFAVLNWSPGGYCDSTIIEFGAPGFELGTGIQAQLSCPPDTLFGLTGGSEFDLYIFENCNGIPSQVACDSLRIHTKCAPPPLSIFENFDTLSKCIGVSCQTACTLEGPIWSNITSDDLDWLVRSGNTPTGFTGPSSDCSGLGNYIYLESSSFTSNYCAPNSEAILISNCIEIDDKGTDSCHMSFKYHMYGNDVNNLSLELTDDGQTWNTIWTLSGNQGNDWHHANIRLADFHGLNVQFRFVAKKGQGNTGDIAIDDIKLFGSIDHGSPSFIYYADADNDGYGDSTRYIHSCFNQPPLGYTYNKDDCDDTNPNTSLLTDEIPCNGIDENCNGMADDFELPQLSSEHVDICHGQKAILQAMPNYGGNIDWFDINYNWIGTGQNLDLGFIDNTGNQALSFSFFVIETKGYCYSVEDTVILTIHPQPELFTEEQIQICAGESIDLNDLVIEDLNNTGGNLTFHTDANAEPSSELASSLVRPLSSRTYYARMNSSSSECFSVISVFIEVVPAVSAEILYPSDTITLCKGASTFLKASSSGGTGNLIAQWHTFETNTEIRIPSAGQTGIIYPATYSVVDSNLCYASDTVYIKTVSSIEAAITNFTEVNTCNGQDGEIYVEPVGGTPPFQYNWSGPHNGSASNISGPYSITQISQGNYAITVSDSSPEACSFVLPSVVVNGLVADIKIDSIVDVNCFGQSNGGIYLSVNGTNPVFEWSNSGNEEDQTGLSAGTYSVTITTNNCETVISNLKVNGPDSLYIAAQIQHPKCYNSLDGAINIQVLGGNGNNQFNWSNGDTTKSISGLGQGFYGLSVIDQVGCTFQSSNFILTEPDSLQYHLDVNPAICFEEASGQALVTASGGTSPYHFSWSNGSELSNQMNLQAGDYALTITDKNECSIKLNSVIVDQPNPVSFTLDSLRNASCAGINDGYIALGLSGGSGAFTLEWNNMGTTSSMDSLGPGKYSLNVLDDAGCLFQSDTFEITAPDGITYDLDIQSPLCLGTNDGKLSLANISTGHLPYSIIWENSDTTEVRENLTAGTYAFTITDANGCFVSNDSILLDAPQRMDVSNLEIHHPICNGDSNAVIRPNVFNGSLPLSYSWNTGETLPTLTNIASGFYSLTVTDADDCELRLDSIGVFDYSPIEVYIDVIDSLQCHNDLSGAISVSAYGGAPPYTSFSWNNNTLFGPDISNLEGDKDYLLTVRDSRGCLYEADPIFLENPAPIQLGYEVKISTNCQAQNGQDSVLVSVQGGTPPYFFNWDNGAFSQDLIGINPGEYNLTVTDSKGCKAQLNYIKVPTNSNGPRIKGFVKQDVSCYNAKNGSISIQLDRGIAPYTYVWSDGIGSFGTSIDGSIQVNNLDIGSYFLSGYDAVGCVFKTDTVTISQPNVLIAERDFEKERMPTCFGGSDGHGAINISGGNYPYTVYWINSNLDTVSNLEAPLNLPAGDYQIFVKDAMNCEYSIQGGVQLVNPPELRIDTAIIYDLTCHADNSGRLELTVAGGTPIIKNHVPTYFYGWENGDTSRIIDELASGWYPIEIVDNNNCVLRDSFYVDQPDSLNIDSLAVSDPSCAGMNTGLINFSVTGGTPAYHYLLDGFNATLPFEDLTAQHYQIAVFDQLGCFKNFNIQIQEPDSLTATFTFVPADPLGSILANAQGGTPPYTYIWNTGDTTALIENLVGANYCVTITDSLNCEYYECVQLTSDVEEQEAIEEFNIFPNPSPGLFELKWSVIPKAPYLLKVKNMEGQLMYLVEMNNKSASSTIDLTSLADGVYIMQLSSLENSLNFHRKLIIQH